MHSISYIFKISCIEISNLRTSCLIRTNKLTYVILDSEFTLRSLNQEKSWNAERIITSRLKSFDDKLSVSNLMFGHLVRYFMKQFAWNGRLRAKKLKFSIKTSCIRIYTSTICQLTTQNISKRLFSQCWIKTNQLDQIQLKYFNQKISQSFAMI